MKKQPSLSSLTTLGDSNHYSSNHKCYKEQNWLGCRSRWWLCGGCGGSPRQRCQSSKNLMESNGYGSIFVGRGMSRAFQGAKEHQKGTPDELVMDRTVKWERLKCQGPDIRGWGLDIRGLMSNTVRVLCFRSRMSGLGPGCPARWAGCPGTKSEDELEEHDLGAEIDDFGAKLRRFRGWKVGKIGKS